MRIVRLDDVRSTLTLAGYGYGYGSSIGPLGLGHGLQLQVQVSGVSHFCGLPETYLYILLPLYWSLVMGSSSLASYR